MKMLLLPLAAALATFQLASAAPAPSPYQAPVPAPVPSPPVIYKAKSICNCPAGSGWLTLYKPSTGGYYYPDYPDVCDGTMKYDLGLKFLSHVAGDLGAIRYYKATREAPTQRTVKLYDWETGYVLATYSFYDEGCGKGWVVIKLPTPIPLYADKYYAVSVEGIKYYAKSDNLLYGVENGPLVAGGSGPLYTYKSAPLAFWSEADYWIDVEFYPKTYYTPYAGCNGWPTAPVQTYFTPSDVPYSKTNLYGDGLKPLVLGVVFSTTVAGDISAVRYYKAPSEYGLGHVGKIYDAAGKLVATTITGTDDSSCTIGKWVTIPLAYPYRTSPGIRYTLALDSVTYYAKSDKYYNGGTYTRGKIVHYGATYGTVSGGRPTAPSNANYYIDFEFKPYSAPARELEGGEGEEVVVVEREEEGSN